GEGTLQLIVGASGRASAPCAPNPQLRETEPSAMRLVPGDTVYIPAGVPTRILVDRESIQVRLKAEPPGREAVAWYCAACGELVHTEEIAPGIVQDQYWRATMAFNEDAALRTCKGWGAVPPAVDLGDIAWPDVAAALRTDDD